MIDNQLVSGVDPCPKCGLNPLIYKERNRIAECRSCNTSAAELNESWRFTTPGNETCDTGTCIKCGVVYERLRHFDYCPKCGKEIK